MSLIIDNAETIALIVNLIWTAFLAKTKAKK